MQKEKKKKEEDSQTQRSGSIYSRKMPTANKDSVMQKVN